MFHGNLDKFTKLFMRIDCKITKNDRLDKLLNFVFFFINGIISIIFIVFFRQSKFFIVIKVYIVNLNAKKNL